jgi:hypothetical protein
MKFAFKIFWMQNGQLELLLEPDALDVPSITNAREIAEGFAAHAPAHSISIESEDGLISERWFWLDGEWTHHERHRSEGLG